jgi:ABC-type uncharacterized transport system permease subunit
MAIRWRVGYSWAELDELCQKKSFNEQEDIRKRLIERDRELYTIRTYTMETYVETVTIKHPKLKKQKNKKKKKSKDSDDRILDEQLKKKEASMTLWDKVRESYINKILKSMNSSNIAEILSRNLKGERQDVELLKNVGFWNDVCIKVYEAAASSVKVFQIDNPNIEMKMPRDYYEHMLSHHIVDSLFQCMFMVIGHNVLAMIHDDHMSMLAIQSTTEMYPKVDTISSIKNMIKYRLVPSRCRTFKLEGHKPIAFASFYSLCIEFNMFGCFYIINKQLVFAWKVYNRSKNIDDVDQKDMYIVRKNASMDVFQPKNPEPAIPIKINFEA